MPRITIQIQGRVSTKAHGVSSQVAIISTRLAR